jgi:alpha-tubulin suppressor-like RCC1 family protein
MSGYNTNFRTTVAGTSNVVDLACIFVRKDYFTEGGLWGWGGREIGQLGDNKTCVNKSGNSCEASSPVQTISGGTNWKSVSHTRCVVAAIKSDGTLWTWGSNSCGALGDNTSLVRSSPVQTISGGTNWKKVSTLIGFFPSVFATKTDGTLWTWGSNSCGELGNNSTINASSPVQTIAGGSNWKEIAGGAAIKTDGTLWTWGDNASGRLGDNTTIRKSSPVQTIAGGSNWKQVSAESSRIAAIKTDGTLWIWGPNAEGTLGDNTITCKSSPVQTISGGTNWRCVYISGIISGAIKTDGTLWMWGRNCNGGLGNNSTIDASSPVQTIAGGTNWRLISLGLNASAGVKTDGTLWTWGNNGNGRLGDNTTISKSSPVQTIAGGTTWLTAAAGIDNVFGIREGCW